MHARTYPAATQKGVADVCLCQLATMYMQMHVHKIFSSRMIYAVDRYVSLLKQRVQAVNMMIKMTIK